MEIIMTYAGRRRTEGGFGMIKWFVPADGASAPGKFVFVSLFSLVA